jgi:hypothetical protein
LQPLGTNVFSTSSADGATTAAPRSRRR